jgi:hypothetical protein
VAGCGLAQAAARAGDDDHLVLDAFSHGSNSIAIGLLRWCGCRRRCGW